MRFSPSSKTFFPEEWNYPQLPADIIDITDEQHAAVINRPFDYTFDYIDGQFVISPPPALTLDQIKAAKLAELAYECAKRMEAIKAGYPADEVSTWDKQESEARAYVANSATTPPLLSALAAARGISLPDLVTRVIAKADAFAVVSGALIGKRQKYEDEVSAAVDAAVVAAMTWQD